MDSMPYLIDGHNLIPKLGLRLDSIDDEMQLIGILQEFCRLERRAAEVYFDGAPAGQARTQKFGVVTAHFIRIGTTADSAIKIRLEKMERAARNWIVVSSDHAVQDSARAVHADVISSDKFAELFKKSSPSKSKSNVENKLTSEEVEAWLKLFGRKE
jgi:predicted RNA-binding protein with PIN domain